MYLWVHLQLPGQVWCSRHWVWCSVRWCNALVWSVQSHRSAQWSTPPVHSTQRRTRSWWPERWSRPERRWTKPVGRLSLNSGEPFGVFLPFSCLLAMVHCASRQSLSRSGGRFSEYVIKAATFCQEIYERAGRNGFSFPWTHGLFCRCARRLKAVGVVVYRSSRPTCCLKQVSLRGFQFRRDSCIKLVSLLLRALAHPSKLLDLCAFNYPACFMSCLFVFFFTVFFFSLCLLCVCVFVCAAGFVHPRSAVLTMQRTQKKRTFSCWDRRRRAMAAS